MAQTLEVIVGKLGIRRLAFSDLGETINKQKAESVRMRRNTI